MFGRPGQTLLEWEQELARVVALGVDHVSLYELTVKRGTALHKAIGWVYVCVLAILP